MKILIYFVLIIAFLMFYRQSPVISIILVIIFLASYIYYKSRNGRNSSNRSAFFSGRQSQSNGRVDDLVTLVVLQQMFDKPSTNKVDELRFNQEKSHKQEEQIEKIKHEILELLEE